MVKCVESIAALPILDVPGHIPQHSSHARLAANFTENVTENANGWRLSKQFRTAADFVPTAFTSSPKINSYRWSRAEKSSRNGAEPAEITSIALKGIQPLLQANACKSGSTGGTPISARIAAKPGTSRPITCATKCTCAVTINGGLTTEARKLRKRNWKSASVFACSAIVSNLKRRGTPQQMLDVYAS